MTRLFQSVSLSALLMAPTLGVAATCDEALAALRAEFAGNNKSALLAASEAVRGAGCNLATERAAMGQTSAVLAQRAQALVAVDDLTGPKPC